MGRIHISQSPLTQIVTNIHRFKMDKYFRLYAILWLLLLVGVGLYSWQAVLKSIESYDNPDRHVTLKVQEYISFPPLVFCASNKDAQGFQASMCKFLPRGNDKEERRECDIVPVDLTMELSGVPMKHSCLVLRGIKPSASEPPQGLLSTASGQATNEQTQPASLLQTQSTVGNGILANRLVANATYPSSQFQISFDAANGGEVPFANVLFHAVIHKTVTQKEASRNRYVPSSKNPNPVYVPRSVDGWIRLYPDRTEEIVMQMSTVTYLDETVVYKYKPELRAIPCHLPNNTDCSSQVSAHIRFHSLDTEDAKEEVDFDWLYVLGAIGGALTVAEIAFMFIHPLFQRLLFGKAPNNHKNDDTDDDDTKDPLIS